MKWKDVRDNYLDKFVLFEIMESTKVDDIKVIEVYENGKDARNAFIKKKPNQFVYSTKNIIIHSTTKFLDCIIKHYQGREPIFV